MLQALKVPGAPGQEQGHGEGRLWEEGSALSLPRQMCKDPGLRPLEELAGLGWAERGGFIPPAHLPGSHPGVVALARNSPSWSGSQYLLSTHHVSVTVLSVFHALSCLVHTASL